MYIFLNIYVTFLFLYIFRKLILINEKYRIYNMKDLRTILFNNYCDKQILIETSNLIAEEVINESFQSSILSGLAKAIKDAESKHAENDKEAEKRYKEEGRGYKPTKTAKSFASIFGPLEETPRYGDKKTGIRGLKWSEIKDDDFQYFEADTEEWDKKFVKLLRSVYQKKIMADVICCKPGTKEVVNFIKGYSKTAGDVRVYYFPTTGWKTGVQEKTATKYKYGERSLKFDETVDVISGYDIYYLEVKEDMIKNYDELHKSRLSARKGSIELDEESLYNLLKQQQARYKTLVKEIKAKKLQADPNVLLDEIKETNDKAVELFRKVISNPENMDMRFDIDDLMRYMSYSYEQFYKSMKSKRDSDKSIERAKQRAKERGEEFNEKEFRKWNYDQSSSDEYIRDSKEYLQKVKKIIKQIEENIK